MNDNLLAAFVHQAGTRPGSLALVVSHNDRTINFTWSQLSAMVVDVAENLEADRIGFASDNSLADVVLPLACMVAGAVEVPFDHRLGDVADELWKTVEGQWLSPMDRQRLMERTLNTKPAAKHLRTLENVSQEVDLDSESLILWTSGTTSAPKGVVLSHRNLVGNAQAKFSAVPQSSGDVRLTALPLCHAYARTCDFGTWLLSGCTLAVGFGLEAWRSLGPMVSPTLANTVPSIAQRLLNADPRELGLDRLRLLGCGGAAMNDVDFARWRDRGVTVIQGYGLTETSPVICSATPEDAAAGLVGEFVDGWESEIRDGRLFVRGPHVMKGYWNDAVATAQRIDADGWLDTGDIVQVDSATGQLRILGRADDVIVLSDGHKVHPQSIERDIQAFDGIQHAMIVGAGRRIDIWIDADDSIDIEVLREKMMSTLAHRPSWEQPAQVFRFDSPLTRESGELTEKGAIRRERILENRLSNK